MKLVRQLSLAVLWSSSLAADSFDHSAWNRVLQAYVNQIGEVDYAALKKQRTELDSYLRLLGEASPDNRPALFPSRAHELAYWLNAYNAFVIREVVDNYPTRSVRDLGARFGFFRRKAHVAGGVKMSLLHLENDIIRKKYGEPRIHFGLVCASLSCPMLAQAAFTAENLEGQLERLASKFINERRNLTIHAAANEVTLSEIFKWYKEDFEAPAAPGRARQTVIDYLRRYADAPRRQALDGLKNPRIKYYDYDWSINEPGSRTGAKSPLERVLAKGGC